MQVVKVAEQTYLSKLPPEKQPTSLTIRGPLLFGISECERARLFFKLLIAAGSLPTPTSFTRMLSFRRRGSEWGEGTTLEGSRRVNGHRPQGRL